MPPAMEKCIQPVQLEVNAVSDSGIVEGYASVFETMTDYGQVFKQGAFSELNGIEPKKIKVLFNHDWNSIVGVPLEVREDSKGLYTKTQLLTRTAKGAEMYELAKAGALDAFSIGFYVKDSQEEVIDNQQVINITKADVIEYSLVTFPANPGAKITNVNSKDSEGEGDSESALDLEPLKNQCATILQDMALRNAAYRLSRIAAQFNNKG